MSTPILSMLRRYAKTNPARFHMPGHMGRGMDLPAALDVTELDGTDSLYDSGPYVLEARRLAAKACGAADTFLLVGGATQGIHAMIASVDGRILTARNAHRSVFAAGWLSGRDAAAVTPQWDARECLFRSEVPVLAAAAGSGDWVLVTSPSYMGCVSDLRTLAGTGLLVDAAHGAHFSFGNSLPDSPAPWAHLWVESAHKDAVGAYADGVAASVQRGRWTKDGKNTGGNGDIQSFVAAAGRSGQRKVAGSGESTVLGCAGEPVPDDGGADQCIAGDARP